MESHTNRHVLHLFMKIAEEPLFPFPIFEILETALAAVELIENEDVPPFPVQIIDNLLECIIEIDGLCTPMSEIFRVLFPIMEENNIRRCGHCLQETQEDSFTTQVRQRNHFRIL